jgi:BASS family bile acid:Na+ symporter
MPVIMPLLAEGARVSPWAIARPLLVTMFLPLVVGFIIRPQFPTLSQRAVPILAKVLTLALWTMVALSLFLNRGAVIGILGEGAIVLSLLFFATAYGIGYLSGGFDKPEREVLGFGASQRNFAAAVVVATGAFEDPKVFVMVIVMSLVGMLLIPFSSYLGRRKERAGAPPAFTSRESPASM